MSYEDANDNLLQTQIEYLHKLIQRIKELKDRAKEAQKKRKAEEKEYLRQLIQQEKELEKQLEKAQKKLK